MFWVGDLSGQNPGVCGRLGEVEPCLGVSYDRAVLGMPHLGVSSSCHILHDGTMRHLRFSLGPYHHHVPRPEPGETCNSIMPSSKPP
jgi:hypothetical protein